MPRKKVLLKLFVPFFIFSNIIISESSTYNTFASNTSKLNLTSIKSSSKVTSINSYSQFYAALKNAMTSKTTNLTLKINNYNQSTYNINKTLIQLQTDCFNAKHYLTSSKVSISGFKTSRSKTMNIYLSYENIDSVANSKSSLIDSVVNAAKNKKKSITIKTKNTIASFNNIVDEINVKLPKDINISQLYSQTRNYNGSNILLIKYSLEYDTINNTLPSEDEFYNSNKPSINSTVINDQNTLYNTLKNSINNCDSSLSIVIKDSKIRDSVLNTVTKVLEDNPDIAYLNNWRTSTMGSSVTVTFNYRFTRDTIINMKKSVENKARSIINSIIKPGMNDLEKEKAIHDYIVNNTKYDENGLNSGSIPQESFTDYGALVKGLAVCEGYAKAMYRLCKLANIPCIVVSGTANNGSGSIGHAWNIVKIDNKYYHVDTTWDDPIFYYNGVKTDTLKYDYFNISDLKISKNHTWDKSKYPVCK